MYLQHKDLDLFVGSLPSNYKVITVDTASPNKNVSYVMLKETRYVVHRSPSLAATTASKISKITVTYSVLTNCLLKINPCSRCTLQGVSRYMLLLKQV